MKQLLWFLTLFVATTIQAAEPEVYTGVLAYANSNRVTLIRLFVIPKVDSKTPDMHLNHYLGGFNSDEMITTYFDFVTQEPDGTYVLSDRRSQMENAQLRVPTLFLKKNADGGYEGDYVSTEEGVAGKVTTVKGWSVREDMTKSKLITPSFQGDYMATCTGITRNRVIELMELVATRFESKDMSQIPGADATLKVINYLGALSCAPSNYPDSVPTNCGAFDRGSFDHYKMRLSLHVSLEWQYMCDVSDEGHLSCEGPRRTHCDFTRFTVDGESNYDIVGSPPPFNSPPSSSPVAKDETTTQPPTPQPTPALGEDYCAEFKDLKAGLLQHGMTGLYQRITIDARVTPTELNGQKACQLVGAVRQHFHKTEEQTIPPLTHVLSGSWLFPQTGRGRIGASRVGGDAQIFLTREGKEWRGQWYSALFGYVGEIVLAKDSVILPSHDPEKYVQSISGIFVQEPQHGFDIKRMISIFGFPDTSDTISYDPIRQVRMSGNLETTAFDTNNDPGMSTVVGLDTITYNYFNGIATFIGPSAFYRAKVGYKSMIVKVMVRRFGGNYMPVQWKWDFVRQTLN